MADNGGVIRDFSWEEIGDIDAGRPNLGLQAPVAINRLLLGERGARLPFRRETVGGR